MHTHILFILSLVLLWFNTTTAHTCIDKERQALLDFKAPLQDPFNRLSTWRPEEEEDCCQWLGVTCNIQTGHVTELDLYGGFLEGEITLSLLNLTYLSRLDLSENKFSGVIPDSIGSLTKLTDLSLGWNNFSGTIPMSIGSLTKLTSLDLAANNFSGVIPSFIGNMTQLTVLELSDNSFYGTIPREFGNLTNLEYLHLDSLGSCRVENLDWLSSLSSLERLGMDGTSLAKANNWVNVIIGLQNLSTLSLVGCDLSHAMHPYSSSVNSSSSIDVLFLQKNNLNSPMYNWLCPLFGKKLAHLYISGNMFDGNLSDFLNTLSTSAITLYTLDASSNQFTGSLSNEIQNFSILQTLNLSLNQLNGTISDKLWQLPNLQMLYLSYNSLTGAISDNMLKSNFVCIDLSYNSLEGALSNDDMSNLSQSIEYIDLSSNKLGPPFPKWTQNLKNLTHLDLSNNSISDTVSTEYWNQWKSSQLG
ncbi:leucine-rich repeat-containing protein [Tanacetum coccineum]